MAKENSYDYQNVKRDLSDAIETQIKSSPVLSELIRFAGVATNTKHEWLEDIVSPMQWTTSANYTAADGNFTITSTVGMKAGDILQFEKTTGARSTLFAKITSVDSATAITITVYGGSTDENITSGAIVTLLSRPKNEGTSPDPDNGYEPTTEYNYTQIMDRTAKVSKTSVEVPKYGIGGALDYQVQRQLLDIGYELENTIINGRRVVRSSSSAGTMGGILYFLSAASTAKLNAAGAISTTILNNAFELGRAQGMMGASIILCHPVQARKISAFNTAGTNPVTQIMRSDTTTGSYVTTYVSDQGDVVTIVANRNMDKDKIAILDMSKIALVPLQNRQFTDEDATPAGADYYARRILGEYTLEVKNAGYSHVYIYGLSI